jgi:hypothetical protein
MFAPDPYPRVKLNLALARHGCSTMLLAFQGPRREPMSEVPRQVSGLDPKLSRDPGDDSYNGVVRLGWCGAQRAQVPKKRPSPSVFGTEI